MINQILNSLGIWGGIAGEDEPNFCTIREIGVFDYRQITGIQESLDMDLPRTSPRSIRAQIDQAIPRLGVREVNQRISLSRD